MAPTRTQRWLDLIALLVGRRTPLGVDQIMERVPSYRTRWMAGTDRDRASVRRMFERDKDDLRRIGIPLVTRPLPGGEAPDAVGYLIEAGDFYLPAVPGEAGSVRLSEPDARTAVLALREVLALPNFPFQREARSALHKLTFDLDPGDGAAGGPPLGEGPEGAEAPRPVTVLERPGGADPARALRRLAEAVYDRRRVRFTYESPARPNAEATPREVEPWGLLFQWGAWYLAAHDPSRAAGPPARLYRIDRMRDAALARPHASAAEFEVPETFDLRSLAGRRAWELDPGPGDGHEVEAVVRFAPTLADLAERNGWGRPVEDDPGPGSARAFPVRRRAPFLRWILAFAGEASLEAPPGLVDELRTLARKVEAVHAEGG